MTKENSSEKDLCETSCMKQRNPTVRDPKQGNSTSSLVSWGNFLLATPDGQPFNIRKKEFGSVSKALRLLIFIFSSSYYSSLSYYPIHLSDFLKSCSAECLVAMNSAFLLGIPQATGYPEEWMIFPWARMVRA